MFFRILLGDLIEKNSDFFHLLLKAIQFNEKPCSALPSLLFLVFSMCIIHRFTHRNLGVHRNINLYRDALYREIAFQWLYLYLTKIWFYVVKAFRLVTTYLINSIKKCGGTEFNIQCVNLTMYSLFCFVCFIPMFLLIFHFKDDEPHQNFLMWIPRNRWTRSELGTAGRLMERPPNRAIPARKYPAAYKTKRSISSEINTNTSEVDIIRYCRSGFITKQPVSSINEMTAL